MVIKSTVSQTSGSFSSMRAGSFFYYWHGVLVNIINCISIRIQYLQEKGCEVAQIHTQDNTYECIKVEKYEEKLHYCFFHLSGVDHVLI